MKPNRNDSTVHGLLIGVRYSTVVLAPFGPILECIDQVHDPTGNKAYQGRRHQQVSQLFRAVILRNMRQEWIKCLHSFYVLLMIHYCYQMYIHWEHA